MSETCRQPTPLDTPTERMACSPPPDFLAESHTVPEPSASRDVSTSSPAPSCCPLLSLPPEIINEIVSLLKSDDNRDLFGFAKTCRRLHHATIPTIFARVSLGYYGLAWEGRDPSRALKTLQLLREPGLARYAVFIDHVDSPLPTFTRASAERGRARNRVGMMLLEPPPHPVVVMATQNERTPPLAPPLPSLPPAPPDLTLEGLQDALMAGMANLYQAQVRTIRIVRGSDPVIQALLEYVVRRDCVRKLWVEDVPLRSLAHFLESTPEVLGGFTTGLTHLRLRKLLTTRSILDRARLPNDDCCPRFIQTIVSHSPNLTSLTLETVRDVSTLPEILDSLTFPALTAFQLRSQTENDGCMLHFHLTNDKIIGFLLRHPKLRAFAWPAERFLSHQSHEPLLAPLIEHFSRRLVWFRSDCSLLRAEQLAGRPNPSRLFVAAFLRRMEMVESIKLQGDFLREEMSTIHAAIASSSLSAKMKKYSLIRPQVDSLHEIVAAMPNLRELKLCAYFTPGLISFYDTAIEGVREADGSMRHNLSLERFLQHIAPLKHLQKLTIPFHTGLDMSDVVVSDIWDEYRERHPASRSFSEHPHYKVLASEIDMDAPLPSKQITRLEHGILQQINPDMDVNDAQPSMVVKHLMKNLRRAARMHAGFQELRLVRCFFILSMEETSLDINEFFVDVEHRPTAEDTEGMGGAGDTAPQQSSRLELAYSPVLAYGWGTGLWQGDTKPLRSRAWFGSP